MTLRVRVLGLVVAGLTVLAASVLTPVSALAIGSPPSISNMSTSFNSAAPFSQIGLTTGGDTLILSGANLDTVTSVTIGGASTSIVSKTTAELQVTTPAGNEGEAAVVVIYPGGSVTSPWTFGYVARPTVTGVSIGGGSIARGDLSLIVTGTDFVAGQMLVQFNGVNASVGVNNATRMTVTPPAGFANGATVTVRKRGIAAANTPSFTYALQPKITAVSPNSGSTAGGTTVTITGTEFDDVTSVTIGGAAATIVTKTSTSLVVTTPAGTGAEKSVVVTSPGGSDTKGAAFDYTIAAPAITGLSPSTGPSAGGTSVTLTGSGFTGATSVTVGATAVASFTVVSDSQITLTTASGAAGIRNITVVAPGGSAQSAATFTYVDAPTVSSVTPSGGPTTGGGSQLIAIRGANLTGATVTLGGQAVTINGTQSDTAISFTPPAGSAGAKDIVVTTAGGSVTVAGAYTYAAVTGPTLSAAFSPSTVAVGQTSTLTFTLTNPSATAVSGAGGSTFLPAHLVANSATITGTCSASSVDFGGAVMSVSHANLAAGASCTTTVQVSANQNGSYSIRPGDFSLSSGYMGTNVPGSAGAMATLSVVSLPTITSLDVTEGPAFGVTQVALTGTNLDTLTALTVGGTAASVVSVQGSTSVTFLTPPRAAGAADVVVTTDSGSATKVGAFTYIAAPEATPSTANVAYGSSANPVTLNLSGGPPTSLTITSPAAGGTATVNGTAITYTPNAGYSGFDTFVYKATNVGGTSSAVVTVTVAAAPLAPTIRASFSPASVTPGVSSSLVLTLTNPGSTAMTNVTARTVLPNGISLFGAPTSTCSGSISTIGVDTVVMSGISLTGNASCTYTTPVSTTVAGTFSVAPGADAAPSATVGGVSVTGLAGSSTSLTVGYPAPVANNIQTTAAYGLSTIFYADTTGFSVGGATATQPAHGTLIMLGGYQFMYTPASGFYGVDTFTYTVTGPGGTSAPGTVTITVAAPPAPTANVRSNFFVAFGAPSAIDMSTVISGIHSSIAVVTAPAHGTTSVSGDVVTYTPAAGYYGPDSYDYTATGPGGTTAPAHVSFTVDNPPAPTAQTRAGVAVPFNSSGVAIDLSSAIGGVHSGVTIAFGPQHGTASVAGDVVTYRPTTGYYGADGFTYTITGPGGLAVAAVTLTVASPAIPSVADRNGVGVAYDSAGQAIDLSPLITGVHSAVAVATAPAHGSVSIAGDVVTYTPQAGYYGADSFTYTATGPGGASAPATVSLTVASPAAPVAANRTGVAVAYNSSGTAIDLGGSINGVHTTLAVASAPTHGTVSVVADVATYTPAAGYFGADGFTYTATGPGGTSAPATVSLTVATPAAPTAANRGGVAIPYASPGAAIDLAGGLGGVYTQVSITSAPVHGTASVLGAMATYVPATGYYGADSFSYVATGPGGASAAATVSLTVATPPAPTVANRSGVAVAYDSGGTTIDLSGSINGVHTSLAIATAAAHGTASVSGDIVTYVPAAGYFGADSFTLAATGPGGVSAPATVSVTVATPAAPTAADKAGVQVAYASTGTAIDLAPSVSGVKAGITVGAPAHGSATLAGYVVTYVPTAGYYGADSFTYTATGPGGVSTPATVSLTVATPAAPTAGETSVDVAHGMARTIDLAPLMAGVHTSAAVAAAPQHGAVVLNGLLVTYTPAPGYAGADSFTYTATGPGGTSAPARVSLTVGAAPEASAKSLTIKVDPSASGSNAAGPVQINLADAVRNAVSIEIVRAPAHGLLTVNGLTVTYTPDAGFYGTDTFTYRAVGQGVGGASSVARGFSTLAVAPSGPVSAEATVTIQIAAPPITAPSLSANTLQGRAVAVNLTNTAQGGPFTAATIVTSTAAHGSAVIERDGQAFVLRFTPKGDFSGLTRLTYTLSNANGTSLPGEVAITVQARPNPLADAAVMALASAEIEDARRFGSTQIDIFGRRMERLHADDAGSGNTIALAMNGAMRLPLGKLKASEGAWKLWADGTVNVGTFSPNAVEFDLSTDGLTLGADRKLGKDLAIGFGLGFSQGDHEAGSAKLETENYLAAAYGSWRPKAGLFVDGLLGVGKIAHDVERKVAASGATLSGARDGDLVLASLTSGLDRAYGDWRFSYYARASLLDGDLDAYVETGDPIYALAFETQSLSSATLALGTKIERRYDLAKGSFVPRLRLEYQQELKGAGSVQARYADWAASPLYSEALIGAGRSQFLVGFGGDLDIEGRRFNFDYSVRTDTDRATDQRLTVGAQFSF